MHKLRRKAVVGDKGIDSKIRRIIGNIKARMAPEKILLFGSFARGDYHEKSDVDLVVVADFKERFFERIGKVLECNDTDLVVEALAYTPEEFERKKTETFLRKALAEGVWL
ncbi:nucleotidyltransferase domain-containing protein [Candidatus Micrarchaeota archaeon]|nr:nucleotidyltransferase domain-containing protein [Candidatus Micrarchaeota archaeon]